MRVLDYMEQHGHEQLAVWTDPSAGLRAFIAIHDTALGPSLGGLRIWPYASEDEAVLDVLRLSRAMTYKSAVAGLDFGGGKSVIMADSRTDKTEAMFRSFGRFVESLGGRYIVTEDVGTSPQDLEWVSHETKHVVGLSKELGGSGNPSGVTGFGVYQAMRACAVATWGNDSLEGRTVAIQGFGNVAHALSGHLLKAGAKLLVADIHEEKLADARSMEGVAVVPQDQILGAECDVLAPCALGGILNAETIPQLRCQVVCGGANNQLAGEEDADRLVQWGILYAPDYVANAGGVINVSYEVSGSYSLDASMEKTSHIYDTMGRIIATAREKGITTAHAADTLAEERLAAGRAKPVHLSS
jgi:leucine dehydrogenase